MGLEIKNIELFNKALLAKWRWTMSMSKENLWCRIIRSKYGVWEEGRQHRLVGKEYWWWWDLWLVCGGEANGRWFDKRNIWKKKVVEKETKI